MDTSLPTLQQWINESEYIVFFGGAGVSTESGIPDFRSVDGLYQQKYPYPPETMLSHSFLLSHSAEFFDFYREKMLALWAKPNPAHLALAALEQSGKLRAVITQNIDGLHQMAGSREVLELHGSVHRNYCSSCGRQYPVSFLADGAGIPTCENCGGMVRPDVVLYEEGLNSDIMNRAVSHLRKADLLIIGGTSLVVYPAAGLVQYFRGKHLVLINKDTTALGAKADLVISGAIGEVLSQIKPPDKTASL